mmetsp:Transcript_9562/g.14670  ORF Transcript_9562/g.14670 Transcript_9562/m.14670 type:complete len:228 (+) Transcript_9562:58-741(+)
MVKDKVYHGKMKLFASFIIFVLVIQGVLCLNFGDFKQSHSQVRGDLRSSKCDQQTKDPARSAFALTLTIMLNYMNPQYCAATSPIFSGIVEIQNGVTPPSEEDTALYITARPDRPDNVPKAILSGTRGKPPPIASARYQNPIFPFEFSITDENLTEEGQSGEKVWWSNDNLIVSARLDKDGVAYTRDPEDLVGRALVNRKLAENSNDVLIQLQGRGIGGKLVTGKSK